MSDRRTKAQLAFDYAKHGWAFCNLPMLNGKYEQLVELAKALEIGDKRHDTLLSIHNKLLKMDGEGQ